MVSKLDCAVFLSMTYLCEFLGYCCDKMQILHENHHGTGNKDSSVQSDSKI